jgi:hypothetical protein
MECYDQKDKLLAMRDCSALGHAYLDAKQFVINSGFSAEIDWQASLTIENVTEGSFLREYAWVVLNAGFRETIMRRLFPRIEECFLNWVSAKRIYEHRWSCRARALTVFGNVRKISAVLETCEILKLHGFRWLQRHLLAGKLEVLKRFPFMGPATSHHLAKNLGLETVKPDRLLSPQHLCETIREVIGDSLSEIDIVLWRFATLCPNAIEVFAPSPSE